MEVQTFGDVFDALADTPVEAANMKATADLLSLLVDHIGSWNIPQEAAATRLGVTRPRLNELMRGKLGKVSLDALVNLATAAGLVLEIREASAARRWSPKAGIRPAGLGAWQAATIATHPHQPEPRRASCR